MQQSKDILRISRSENFGKLRRKDPCYFEGDPVQIISGGFSEIFKNSFDPLDTGHKLSILEIYILFPGGQLSDITFSEQPKISSIIFSLV